MCLLIPAPWVIVIQLSEIIQWIAIGNNKALNMRQEKGTQDIAQPGLLPFPPLAAVWQRSETRALIQITDSRNMLGRHTHLSRAFARSLQGKALNRSPGFCCQSLTEGRFLLRLSWCRCGATACPRITVPSYSGAAHGRLFLLRDSLRVAAILLPSLQARSLPPLSSRLLWDAFPVQSTRSFHGHLSGPV